MNKNLFAARKEFDILKYKINKKKKALLEKKLFKKDKNEYYDEEFEISETGN
jgi:hypothetical protein